MNLELVFFNLIKTLETQEKNIVTISWDYIHRFDKEVLITLINLNLLNKTSNSNYVSCYDCEEYCIQPVIKREIKGKKFSTIPCHYDGYIKLAPHQLEEYQFTLILLGCFIQSLLSTTNKIELLKGNRLKLGMINTPHGRKQITLSPEACIEINGNVVPIKELVYFESGQFFIDVEKLNYLASKTGIDIDALKSNIPQNEIRQSKTQEQNQCWLDEAYELRKRYSEKSDTWIASKIANSPAGNNKSPETIRKIIRKHTK